MTVAAPEFVTPTITRPIENVVLRGRKVSRDISEKISTATVSMAVDSVTQLTLILHDPGLNLLSSGLFRRHMPVDYEDLKLELTNLDTEPGVAGKGQLTIKARSKVVGKLKRRTGSFIMKGASPSQFVIAECKSVGAKYVVQPSSKRKVIKRDAKKSGEVYGNAVPSSWSTFQRLAGELGYYCFEAAGVVYFGQPSWFLKQKNIEVPVSWNDGPKWQWADELPYCQYSTDSDEGAFSVNFAVPLSRAKAFRPGRIAVLSGMPFFNGKYFITGVDYSLANEGAVSVSAKTPHDPEKQERGGGRGGDTLNMSGEIIPATGNRGTKLASDMVYWALRQAGDPYIFGAEAGLGERDPDSFDCSELVQWAAHQAGGYMPDGSANQNAYCRSKNTNISVEKAIRTRGALLFKMSGSPQHVAISLGNGNTIEAVGRAYGVRTMSATDRSFRWTDAGLVPGLKY